MTVANVVQTSVQMYCSRPPIIVPAVQVARIAEPHPLSIAGMASSSASIEVTPPSIHVSTPPPVPVSTTTTSQQIVYHVYQQAAPNPGITITCCDLKMKKLIRPALLVTLWAVWVLFLAGISKVRGAIACVLRHRGMRKIWCRNAFHDGCGILRRERRRGIGAVCIDRCCNLLRAGDPQFPADSHILPYC